MIYQVNVWLQGLPWTVFSLLGAIYSIDFVAGMWQIVYLCALKKDNKTREQ